MTNPQFELTSEQQLVEDIKRWAGNKHIGDDCAVLPGGQLITVDALVEGTHFITGIGYDNLGWKAAAVNLSDIAAMAGRPRHMVVSLTLPKDFNKSSVRELMVALIECAKTYRADVVGGDLTVGPVLVVNVTVIGDVHESGCLTRSNAKAGDVVVVTGDFGASAAGLSLFHKTIAEQKKYPYVWQRHVRPTPRLCESWAFVRQTGERASLMDASDGLADALVQIARASQVGIEVDQLDIPIHEETKEVARLSQIDPLEWALYGGEDYELVGTLPEEIWLKWKDNNPFKAIGKVTTSPGVFLNAEGKKTALDLKKSFQHWQDL